MPDVLEKPRINPRIAQRWIDARREEGRRRLKAIVIAGVVLVVCALLVGSLYSPIFTVRHVRASVEGPLGSDQVIGLSGVDRGALMIDVSPTAAAERLDAEPWLGAAQVKRSWPDTVTMSVVVRSALVVVAAGRGSWAEVDLTGRVLADVAARPAGMPEIRGVGPVPGPGGWLAGSLGSRGSLGRPLGSVVDLTATPDSPNVPTGVTAALAALADLPAEVRSDVLVETVTSGPDSTLADLTLTVSPPRVAVGTVQVDMGDGSLVQAKVSSLLTILDQADLSGVSSIDLSVPSRPATSA